MTYEPKDEETTIIAPPKFDPEEYRDGLAEFELTKEQENELLLVLWNIMSMMVDLGWGLDSAQLILPALAEKAALEAENVVNLSKGMEGFNKAANGEVKDKNE